MRFAPIIAVLLLATPALAQTTDTAGTTAGDNFHQAWTDLKGSAANTWHGVVKGTDAAAHGVKKGWQATKQRADTPSND